MPLSPAAFSGTGNSRIQIAIGGALLFTSAFFGILDQFFLQLSHWNFWSAAVAVVIRALILAFSQRVALLHTSSALGELSRIVFVCNIFGFGLIGVYLAAFFVRLDASPLFSPLTFDWRIFAYGLGPALLSIAFFGPFLSDEE